MTPFRIDQKFLPGLYSERDTEDEIKRVASAIKIEAALGGVRFPWGWHLDDVARAALSALRDFDRHKKVEGGDGWTD